MRRSTWKKLFHDDEMPHTVQQFDIGTSAATMFVINGHTAILQEFENEADGFELYVAAPGNSIDGCRQALGLPTPPKSVGDLMDEDQDKAAARSGSDRDVIYRAGLTRYRSTLGRENREGKPVTAGKTVEFGCTCPPLPGGEYREQDFHDDEWVTDETTGEEVFSKHHYTCRDCGGVTQIG
jgi:hypothetical protein